MHIVLLDGCMDGRMEDGWVSGGGRRGVSEKGDTHRWRSAIHIKGNEPLVPGLWFITNSNFAI